MGVESKYPLPDSNERFRAESLASWAARRRGRFEKPHNGFREARRRIEEPDGVIEKPRGVIENRRGHEQPSNRAAD